jgi:hypothetical protein
LAAFAVIERIEVEPKSLAALVAALNKEADGEKLGWDLARNLAAAVSPAAGAAKSSILTMSSPREVTDGVSLRSAVASRVAVEVRLGGSSPGVAIKAGKVGMPRGFANAPKRLNSRHGWRHKVFGREVWVTQVGRPGWFDDTIARRKPAATKAARQALDAMAKRISDRSRG